MEYLLRIIESEIRDRYKNNYCSKVVPKVFIEYKKDEFFEKLVRLVKKEGWLKDN